MPVLRKLPGTRGALEQHGAGFDPSVLWGASPFELAKTLYGADAAMKMRPEAVDALTAAWTAIRGSGVPDAAEPGNFAQGGLLDYAAGRSGIDPRTDIEAPGLLPFGPTVEGETGIGGSDVAWRLPRFAGLFQAGGTGGPSGALGAGPSFFSKAQKVVEASGTGKASPQQWKATLKNAGVKDEEAAWLGLDEFMEGKKSVTKAELDAHIQANQVQIEEVTKGAGAAPSNQNLGLEYHRLNEDGSESWRWTTNDGRVFEADRDSLDDAIDVLEMEPGTSTVRENLNLTTGIEAQTAGDAMSAIQLHLGGRNYMTGGVEGATKFSEWQLPGGENYRELLLTMPNAKASTSTARMTAIESEIAEITQRHPSMNARPAAASARIGALRDEYYKEAERLREGPTFTGGHFDEPNVLAHVRFNERTIGNRRALFMEEVQSDWHQKGRKEGYKVGGKQGFLDRQQALYQELDVISAAPLNASELGELNQLVRRLHARGAPPGGDLTSAEHARMSALHGKQEAVLTRRTEISDEIRDLDTQIQAADDGVPDAPFKKTWHELAFRRMVRYAAENGFDSVAWTRGEQQVGRYESALRKKVDEIEWEKTPEGVHIKGWKGGIDLPGRPGFIPRKAVVDTTEKETALSDAIGKAMSEKILGDSAQSGTISGADITIDSTGMAEFYDRMLPTYAKKFGKKFGARVGTADVGTKHTLRPVTDGDVWRIYDPITDDHWMDPATTRIPSFSNREDAAAAIKGKAKGAPVHIMDIPEKMRKTAMDDGFPLFSKSAPTGAVRDRDNERGYTTKPDGTVVPLLHAGGPVTDMDPATRQDDMPATLQEGEYVMSREAVEFFGMDYLQQLNDSANDTAGMRSLRRI